MHNQKRPAFRLPRIGLMITALLAILNVPAWSQQAPEVEQGDRPATVERSQAVLPDAARDILQQFQRQSAAAREQFEQENARRRTQTIDRLENLADSYAESGLVKEAAAVRLAIRRIQIEARTAELAGAPAGVLPDPGNLSNFRDRVGQSVAFRVTGSLEGIVWGTDLYTDDSRLAAAAVHAGLVKPDQTAVVKVRIVQAAESYDGSTRNGVTSNDYQQWYGSFRFEGAAAADNGKADVAPARAPALASLRGKAGEVLYISLTGSTAGTVWGTDVYTDDSSLPAAAVHAGLVRDGERGVIKVTIAPAQEAYTGSTRNGVETRNYGEWGGSFRLERVPEGFTPPKIYQWSAPTYGARHLGGNIRTYGENPGR